MIHSSRDSAPNPNEGSDAMKQPRLFQSFWMGGYEGADHVNSHGQALSMNDANDHWRQVRGDYRLLKQFGIRTVRESIGWRMTGSGSALDLSRVRHMADAAAEEDIQVIWSIHHYGTPPGIDPFATDFPERFADFCDAIGRALQGRSMLPTVYQPINEISFLSWALGNTSLMHPHTADTPGTAHEAKRNLVRAALRGCDALWATEPGARIVHNDPLIHVTAAAMADAQALESARVQEFAQYEAWDMLCGRMAPELGGAPRYLDVIGVNYYHGNQWEHPSGDRLEWHVRDPRRVDLADMLQALWQRYGRPQFISETGHVGAGRASWLDEVGSAAVRCRERDIPLDGICLYPLIDRPDWEDTTHWHRSGLWDVPPPRSGDHPARLPRVLQQPYADRLHYWLSRWGEHAGDTSHVPTTAPTTREPLPSFIDPTGPPLSHLIVFSHLRWDFVYQRPQHLLSRLAHRFPVVFMEEPIPNAPHAFLERLHPCEGVEVLRPHLTGAAWGFHDDHIPALQAMLADYLSAQGIDDYWLWFYTPMAVPLASTLSPKVVVYDCMDELAAFKNAPRQLLQRESALFTMADLVFTGGLSLYESKRERHAQVHCFPSSVDAAHFAPAPVFALDGEMDMPTPNAANEPNRRPRIGYYGVIDERIDLPLLEELAAARPAWDFVMVGPVVKIDPATLPRAANIEWPGQRSYDELPGLVAGWDVCLLPFALNESTRFISPTKTLEYLAADKPAVSTPVRDVVRGYSEVIAIASTAEEFVDACEVALARTPEERAHDSAKRAQVVAGTSWDATVAAMNELIENQLKAAQPAAHSNSTGITAGDPPAARAA